MQGWPFRKQFLIFSMIGIVFFGKLLIDLLRSAAADTAYMSLASVLLPAIAITASLALCVLVMLRALFNEDWES